jgi:hypothetical protein
MRTDRNAGYLGLLAVALTGWAQRDARKELVRLQVTSSSGAPVRARVTTRGLIITEPSPSQGSGQAQVTMTISTPSAVTLGGIGDADLELIDSATTIIVDVVQLRLNAFPAQRLVGKAFHVSRTTYTEPYRVTATR